MSDLFPKLAQRVDDMAFIHSMQSKTALHGPAMFMANSGFILPGFPSMGAWVTYGLGSVSEDLAGLRRVAGSARPSARRRRSIGARVSCPQFIRGPRSRPMSRSRPSPICSRRRTSPIFAGRQQQTSRDFLQTLNRAPRRRARGQQRTRSPHLGLRTRRPPAAQRARSDRPAAGIRRHQAALQSRSRRHWHLWPPVPARPSAGRTWRALRADLLWCGKHRRRKDPSRTGTATKTSCATTVTGADPRHAGPPRCSLI